MSGKEAPKTASVTAPVAKPHRRRRSNSLTRSEARRATTTRRAALTPTTKARPR